MTKLDIISDPICPWCYIGKTKLDRALEKHPDHDLVIEWHPFQLNPTMPAEGMDRREYLEAKFGGKEGAIKTYGAIAQAAEDAGIDIDFEGIKRTPSTLNAHRLLHWAAVEGHQNAVVDRLFTAYFKEGQDISDVDLLVSIASDAGMDGEMVRRLLNGDQDAKEIQERDASARERGISGVPCFIIGKHYVVQGAQPTELWEKVISEISEAHEKAGS
ncbi:DsbA family oxidoreductase [Neptunicoccus cionae]|uniref:Polyketide biosynthesis protein n=1 Tax=Neptunicoccus cionae TaxID=2035344 RepID=A0A916QU37_9RHOB|nr:DsbA family oxidoreductase [Amylibacter cionae]GGA11362.1 polyketide biosynthesis protein [Amylibacter cionae]